VAYLFNLFGNVGMNGDTMAGNYDEALDQNTSQTVDAPVAGGNILATGFGTNNVIVAFPAGTVVKAGANVLAGYRMYFASGSREPSVGGTVPQAGKDNLTPAGEALFLRAVELAINNGVAPNLGSNPTITQHPADADGCAGSTVILTGAASGENPLYYQWYLNDTTAVAGGTNAVLSIVNLQPATAGSYVLVVTNAVGAVTSSVANVTIVGTATIASTPTSLTNCPGTSAAFSTTASGSGTLTYTWRRGSTIVQGPDGNSSFSIPSVTSVDNGNYSVTVIGQWAPPWRGRSRVRARPGRTAWRHPVYLQGGAACDPAARSLHHDVQERPAPLWRRPIMQTENRLFDDLARMANGALNTLSGLREEIESRVRERVERMLSDMDMVPREEFDAVKAVAQTARNTWARVIVLVAPRCGVRPW
jgi:BMFP domain-containing protein YqiC